MLAKWTTLEFVYFLSGNWMFCILTSRSILNGCYCSKFLQCAPFFEKSIVYWKNIDEIVFFFLDIPWAFCSLDLIARDFFNGSTLNQKYFRPIYRMLFKPQRKHLKRNWSITLQKVMQYRSSFVKNNLYILMQVFLKT